MSFYSAVIFLTCIALVALVLQVGTVSWLPADRRRRLFFCTCCLICAALGEWGANMLNGTQLIALHYVAKFLDFTFTPLTIAFAAHAITSSKRSRYVISLLMINVLMQIISIPTGFISYIDAAGYHQTGTWYTLYLAICACTMLYMLFELVMFTREHKEANRLVTVLAFLFMIAGILIQAADDSIRIIYLSLAMGLMLMIVMYHDCLQEEALDKLAAANSDKALYNESLQAIAGTYLSAHSIEMDTYEITKIVSTDAIEGLIAGIDGGDAQIRHAMEVLATEPFLSTILPFVNLDTLDARMRNHNMISCEFVGKLNGWCRSNFIAVSRNDDGSLRRVLYAVQVIEEQKQHEENLLTAIQTDVLTGLQNRRAYRMRIEELKADGTTPDTTIISMDVNGLKIVNDTQGHNAGDELLRLTASRIDEVFKPYGGCYRMGGDEFTIILDAPQEQVVALCAELDDKLSRCSTTYFDSITVSIGYARRGDYPDVTLEELAIKADAYMYAAKRADGNHR